MQAVFLDTDTLDRGDLDWQPLQALLPGLRRHGHTGPQQVAERVAGCEVAILNKVRLDRSVLQACPSLRLVCVVATGTDNVDLAAARELGIAVCNIRGYCSASVVQHVFAMILHLTQYLGDHDRLGRGGAWQRHTTFCMLQNPVRELAGRTLGIVGMGELGSAVAGAAGAFGMRVLACQRGESDQRAGRLPLAALLQQSDVISLHCPLTPDTRHLIGRAELAAMKPDALLINTARGALVDAQALAEALRLGRIGGAGIDVLAEEPPVRGNPLLDPTLPRLLLTPHVAWSAVESRQRALQQTVDNIRAFLDGAPRQLVT